MKRRSFCKTIFGGLVGFSFLETTKAKPISEINFSWDTLVVDKGWVHYVGSIGAILEQITGYKIGIAEVIQFEDREAASFYFKDFTHYHTVFTMLKNSYFQMTNPERIKWAKIVVYDGLSWFERYKDCLGH